MSVFLADSPHFSTASDRRPVYTLEQRRLRDQTPWTLVQGVLAPLQFLVFLVSLSLVVLAIQSGEGLLLAGWSVVAKTGVLYLIMVTGAIWEKVVFGQYLFARSFFWEDVFSMLVIALHTAYVVNWFAGDRWLDAQSALMLALAAYGTYVINAGQFLLKLRQARKEAP